MEQAQKPISRKGLAIPHEHGGWGALIEPMLLGFVALPFRTVWPIALLMAMVFMSRTPLRIYLLDWRRKKNTPRTRLAIAYFAAYGMFAALLFMLALYLLPGRWWLPVAVVLPLGFVQLHHDVFNRGRELLPTVLGIIVLSSFSCAMFLAAGKPSSVAAVPWILLVFKGVSAILFVQAQLRKRGPRKPSAGPMLAGHLAGLAAAVGFYEAGLAGPAAVGAFVLLLARAAWFHYAPARKVKTVGWTEILFGLLAAVLIGLGC